MNSFVYSSYIMMLKVWSRFSIYKFDSLNFKIESLGNDDQDIIYVEQIFYLQFHFKPFIEWNTPLSCMEKWKFKEKKRALYVLSLFLTIIIPACKPTVPLKDFCVNLVNLQPVQQ